jgi:hypothetical protein
MNERFELFFDQIRTRPKFIKAADAGLSIGSPAAVAVGGAAAVGDPSESVGYIEGRRFGNFRRFGGVVEGLRGKKSRLFP